MTEQPQTTLEYLESVVEKVHEVIHSGGKVLTQVVNEPDDSVDGENLSYAVGMYAALLATSNALAEYVDLLDK